MSKDLTEALRAIMEGGGGDVPYEAQARGAAPKAKSAAALNVAGKGGGGGGIASPLTETAYADRTFFGQTVLTTTDGFMAVFLRPINRVKFLDANGNPVEIVYKAPS